MRRLGRRYDGEEAPDRESDRPDGKACPECDSDALVESADGTEFVCDGCGLVLEGGAIDRGPEWRAFTSDERRAKSRVGAPTTPAMHDRGLTTDIGWRNEDAHGNPLPAGKRRRLGRLRKWQQRARTKDAGERNLQFALSEIDRMASALGVPRPVREVACVIYRRALEADLVRGRSIEGVATGCLYAAARQGGIPRSLAEVAAPSRVGRKEIGRTYRYVARELSIELEPVDPKQYVPRFCSELGLDEDVRATANGIIEATAEQGMLSGKSPTGYAAAAIYAAARFHSQKRTQRAIADVAGVTEVTIRNRYQEQVEAVGGFEELP